MSLTSYHRIVDKAIPTRAARGVSPAGQFAKNTSPSYNGSNADQGVQRLRFQTPMGKNRALALLGAAVVMLAILACDTGSLVSLVSPTATRTKTPRPTFTPLPTSTSTPEDTPAPAATDTPNVPPSPTKRATATVRPATPKPTVPPAPPPPQFPVTFQEGYDCSQGGPVYEIIGRINRSSSPPIFLGNYVLALLSPDGRLLKTAESVPDGQQVMGLDINCRVSKWYPYNIKIDASEFRGQGPFIVRIVKSKTDATPLSADFPVDFSQSKISFVVYTAQ